MVDVVAAIIRYQDKLIITKRNSTGKFPDLWEFPGGKVEFNESLEQALTRELEEELSINIKDFTYYNSYVHQYDFGVINLACFIVEIDSITMIKLNVHSDMNVIGYEQLFDYDFVEGDRELINNIHQKSIKANQLCLIP